MELSTPKMKTRWSLGDLQNYCKESTRSFNMAMQWPAILEILSSNVTRKDYASPMNRRAAGLPEESRLCEDV
jgi:hypothetical protein